jgi:hypothetical protein
LREREHETDIHCPGGQLGSEWELLGRGQDDHLAAKVSSAHPADIIDTSWTSQSTTQRSHICEIPMYSSCISRNLEEKKKTEMSRGDEIDPLIGKNTYHSWPENIIKKREFSLSLKILCSSFLISSDVRVP